MQGQQQQVQQVKSQNRPLTYVDPNAYTIQQGFRPIVVQNIYARTPNERLRLYMLDDVTYRTPRTKRKVTKSFYFKNNFSIFFPINI